MQSGCGGPDTHMISGYLTIHKIILTLYKKRVRRIPITRTCGYSEPLVLGTSSPVMFTASRSARPNALKIASAMW